MCKPEPMKREWRFYIKDMIGFSKRVLVYTDNLDFDAFITNDLIYDATLRNIELIGEAATHLPIELRQAHPEIPWREIIATRNRLAHGYLTISDSTIWSVVKNEIPHIILTLQNILNETTLNP